MRNTRLTFQMVIGLAVGLVVLGSAQRVFAGKAAQRTFTSADAATQALFAAVQGNNENAIMQVLGGGKEIITSDGDLDDQHDRKLFVEKYQQMHRVAPEADGTNVLYIGAENWPFPIPLVKGKGRWYFDADAGAQELLFRQIGQDEMTALRTCHALSHTHGQQGQSPSQGADDAIVQYARTLLSAQSGSGPVANDESVSTPFHGYSFRRVDEEANDQARETVFIAYPAEYRLTGVMTFVVTPDGAVYEKDLGAKTTTVASTMTDWKPDSTWQRAETTASESAAQ